MNLWAAYGLASLMEVLNFIILKFFWGVGI